MVQLELDLDEAAGRDHVAALRRVHVERLHRERAVPAVDQLWPPEPVALRQHVDISSQVGQTEQADVGRPDQAKVRVGKKRDGHARSASVGTVVI